MTNYSNMKNATSSVRIIAGKWRSRKLTFPADIDTLRPTTDRIRETLFNWLQQAIIGARCLDLFSGSGSLSFEALSRGAKDVTAIDYSAKATDLIRKNCISLECDDLEIITANSLEWLQQSAGKKQFDIVFLDPPYDLKLLSECISLLLSGEFLTPGCIIYLESNQPLEEIELPECLPLIKSKKAGQVYFGVCKHVID